MDHFDIRRISFFQGLQHGNLSVFGGDRRVVWFDEEDEDRKLGCRSGLEMDGHCMEIMIQESNARKKLDHRERLGESYGYLELRGALSKIERITSGPNMVS